jgi:hypothetical protein
MAKIDLRQQEELLVYIDAGTDGSIRFLDIPTMDVAYTLTLDSGLATEQVYTVGSGITLDAGNKTITWTWAGADFPSTKRYIGYLESTDLTIGAYLRIKISVDVS